MIGLLNYNIHPVLILLFLFCSGVLNSSGLSSPALHNLLFNMLSHQSVCSTVSQEPDATGNHTSAKIERTNCVGGALIRSILKALSIFLCQSAEMINVLS